MISFEQISFFLFRQSSFLKLLVCVLFLIGGCAKTGKIENQAVSMLPVEDQRYSFANYAYQNPVGNVLLLLTFSGGGTRAAALSYGVLEELRDTYIKGNGNPKRLLDEVDRISAVSGGSFTAAYYGLFGEKIFDDFKEEFLYKDIQADLRRRILRIFKMIGRQFTGVSRTEDIIEYFDNYLFKGKTFADLQKSRGPFILINATDLNSQSQFVFTQRQFDFFCSDLSQFKIARAVAASSAVPILFQPVLIEKHPDCSFQKPDWVIRIERKALEENSRRLKSIASSMAFYLDENNPPFATLVDGGVSDNLGLRSVLRNANLAEGMDKLYDKLTKTVPITHAIIIVVNASTIAETDIGKSKKVPSLLDTIAAVTDVQLHLYNVESNVLMKQELLQGIESLSLSGQEITPYYIELNLEDIENPEDRSFLNTIPTNFSLTREQTDKLIEVAKILLRQNPDYQKLFLDLDATRHTPKNK